MLLLHFHFELDGRTRVHDFHSPVVPLPGQHVRFSDVCLSAVHPPDLRGAQTADEPLDWIVSTNPALWEFNEGCGQQLQTHVHLSLDLAPGQ